MEPDKVSSSSSPKSSLSDEEISRLAASAIDREPISPPAPVPTSGAFWWLVDRIGPFSAYIALGLTLLAVLTAFIGGERFAWVGIAGLPISLFLVLYAIYLFRRRQQENAARYLLSRQSQEQARREVARLVLEQSQNSPDKPLDEK